MQTRTGPAADYPVVIGNPFTIGDTVWTPNDQLNYDAVGMASVGDVALSGVTGAHKTLPLPSYVEVTNLQTGRTALVRLERRGPLINSVLVELSPEAARQLGISASAPAAVRVRRVNPPEAERAALRQGGEAPLRMDTPEGLLQVLRRKLAQQSPLLPPPSVPPTPPVPTQDMLAKGPSAMARPAKELPQASAAPAPVGKSTVVSTAPMRAPEPSGQVSLPSAKAPAPVPPPRPASVPAAKPPAVPSAVRGTYEVQVGAFSVEANARALAKKLGGRVEKPGGFWLVRMGPYPDSAKAGAALEKARKAGYTDARIQRRD
ncbi:septal ring lytic transglycosylase RlpA family protein [Novosphingobium profundi]|uniref:septal ring lytic transglycosylase RlpA family protein n=1 Tax=Novosphingobium profundi TaxID=1774954 RepID=UPI0031BA1011